MNRPKNIIVIGGSAAGPAAAAKAKRVSPGSNVKMFEAGDFITTGTCEMPYVLSGDIENYKDLLLFDPSGFKKEKGVEVFTRHLVEEIDKKAKEIKVLDLFNGTTHFYKYDKLILTTGAKPKGLKQFALPAENLFHLKGISDLIKVKDYLSAMNVNNVAVVGSGYIGLETANAFSSLGLNVTVIEKENHPIPSAETEIQLLVEELLANNKVRFFGGIKNLKPVYSDERIENLNIDGRLLEIDLVILSIGFEPNSELAKKAKLDTGEFGGITVDARLKTSDPHIYAAGDCIEIIDAVTGRPGYFPLATLARDYGHAAGENAAGGNLRVDPVVKNISVKLWDKFLINVGSSSLEAKEHKFKFRSVTQVANNLVKVMPESEKVFGKVIYENDSLKILGAAFFGGNEVSGYGDIISTLIKLKQRGDILSEINYNYTPPLSPFINLLSLLGRKIKY
jgi:NADPH-dependent 2,4-dienoyl-CoA reductase/sulfur reductase-like enzyme